MTEFSVVGKSVTRVDALEKAIGAAKYCTDLMVGAPGVLQAKVLTSPYPHARILKVDVSQAQRTPGVKVVVTSKDAPAKRYGQWGLILDRYLFARDIVRFVGEPVAAVAAGTVEAAEEALTLIKVEYEELPTMFDPEAAMEPEPPVILHPDFWQYEMDPASATILRDLDMPNVNGYYRIRQGDVEGGFEQADLIVENRFSTARVAHGQLETDCCIAQMGGDGILTVWTSQRVVYRVKTMLCRIFDLPPSQVRVISLYVGGAFGRFPEIEQLTTLLALKAKKPVRLALSREEVFRFTPSQVPAIIYIKDGVKQDGSLIAREIKLIINGGAYAAMGPRFIRTAAFGATPTYRIPNFKLDSYCVYTNEMPNTMWRGVGIPQVEWALESQMDIIADKLGIDPIDFRKRNILNEGERNALGETTYSIGIRECLEKVTEFIEWGKPCQKDMEPWKRGKGIAIGNKYVIGGVTSCVHVKVHEDGTVELRHSSDEVGQGANTVLAQMVAEEFALPMERVRVVRGDTAITPFDGGASSSRTTFITGNAVRLACQDAKRQIFELAAPMLKALPHELQIAGGKIFVEGLPQRAITIPDLFLAGPLDKGGEIIGRGTYTHRVTPIDLDTGQGERINACYTYFAQAVEVAVNIETGQVKMLRVGSAFDIGQPINPKLCEGQIEGGMGMGIGTALHEEVLMDEGKVLNPNFRDYMIPAAAQIPSGQDVKSMIVIAPYPEGPYGAKGLGEATVVSMAPAIGNAIYNAVGVRIRDLPITPERLLKSLKEKVGQDMLR